MQYPDYKRIYFNSIVIELTKKCNSVCAHCYVDASPMSSERLSKEEVINVLS